MPAGAATTRKRFASNAAAALVVALGLSAPASAAELLVLERMGCAWCERFNAEIAPIYPKTQQAEIAPLRAVDVDRQWPEDLAGIAPDRFTPTFVLVDEGREIGRIRGYGGEEFFWFLLDEMISKLPKRVTGQEDPRT